MDGCGWMDGFGDGRIFGILRYSAELFGRIPNIRPNNIRPNYSVFGMFFCRIFGIRPNSKINIRCTTILLSPDAFNPRTEILELDDKDLGDSQNRNSVPIYRRTDRRTDGSMELLFGTAQLIFKIYTRQ